MRRLCPVVLSLRIRAEIAKIKQKSHKHARFSAAHTNSTLDHAPEIGRNAWKRIAKSVSLKLLGKPRTKHSMPRFAVGDVRTAAPPGVLGVLASMPVSLSQMQ